MVARLVKNGRLHDASLRRAFERVPRHRFVPERHREACYQPGALELGPEQTITCPDFVALMIGLLELRAGDRVLEVGTGTGYQAAIIASMGAELTTIEVCEPLHRMAAANLAAQGLERVVACLGDGSLGAPDRAPFDGVVLGCAAPTAPPALVEQLAMGGRLVLPEGHPGRIQTLVRYTKTPAGLAREAIRAAWFVPLVSR